MTENCRNAFMTFLVSKMVLLKLHKLSVNKVLKSFQIDRKLLDLLLSITRSYFINNREKIKDIESTLEKNVKNLYNNVRLGKDLEQHSYATVSQQKKSSKDRNQVEKDKNNDGRNEVQQTFKLVIFGDSKGVVRVPQV